MRVSGFLKKMNEGKYIVTRFTCDKKSIKMRYYSVINTFKQNFYWITKIDLKGKIILLKNIFSKSQNLKEMGINSKLENELI